MKHSLLLIRLFGYFFVATFFLQGCQSYTIVQRNVFADDDGNIVSVQYGRSEKDHVNTFISPATGKEMDFRSKLVVVAALPDGEVFTAWQCMNFLSRGTMYQTDNKKWMLLVNGFSCTIFRKAEGEADRYQEVFRGVLCEIDDSYKGQKDERWKEIPPGIQRRTR